MRRLLSSAALVLVVPSAAAAQVTLQAREADQFVDSMGINVHMESSTPPYSSYEAINQKLGLLGMRHFRDEMNDTDILQKSTGAYYLAIWNDVSVYRVATEGMPGKDIFPPGVPITLSFSTPRSFTVYPPNDSSGVDPTIAYTVSTTPRSIRLELPPEVLLIKVAGRYSKTRDAVSRSHNA